MRTILDKGLKEGATVREVMDALRIALPEAIGKARAENIARTEATTAFNQGRLEAFRETKGFVGAVEFMAITDARTTPICMGRDGLVLAIDDPRLPDNTPPLHYMCRSVLSPVSEFELEDLGGKAYLDKLEKLPAPLKGFGNEPGLDGGRPPGQPPVVQTPSGPRGVAGGGEARGRIVVDSLPGDSSGPIGSGPSPSAAPVELPAGLTVVSAPKVSMDHPAVKEVLRILGGAPDDVKSLLVAQKTTVVIDDKNPFLGIFFRKLFSKPTLQGLRESVRGFLANRAAATVWGVPGSEGVTIFLRPSRMKNPRYGTLHEVGHVVSRALGLVDDEAVLEAFTKEGPILREVFDRDAFTESLSEFLAEGFAYSRHDDAQFEALSRVAPLLHGIINGRMVRLQEPGVRTLYEGDEGFALIGEANQVVFVLRVGGKRRLGNITQDGEVITFSGGSKSFGDVHVSWPEEKVWTAKEAEPYKAFLRSKGVTLPHVMS